jgi:hypothetical protein
MKKMFVLAASLTFATASWAQADSKKDDHSKALAGPCSASAEHSQRQDDDTQREGVAMIPCSADAGETSTGSLTAVRVGAGVAAAAVVAAAVSGGDGSHGKQDTPPGTGGTTGTTGTTGTAGAAH